MRLAAGFTAFYYFLLTVGVSLSMHFCKGELTCLSLFTDVHTCCHAIDNSIPGEEASICSENCCSTEHVIIALDADFTVKFVDNPNNEVSQAVEGFCVPPFVNSQTVTTDAPSRGSPEQLPLYKLNSSYIFYS